jgi:hypothetical protein
VAYRREKPQLITVRINVGGFDEYDRHYCDSADDFAKLWSRGDETT